MGKILIIKGVDFSYVALDKATIEEGTTVIPTITINTALDTATLTTGKTDLDIYYTLDGTTPTTSSTRYTAAIPISSVNNKTIKAISYNGETSSAVPKNTATYDEDANTLAVATTASGTICYTDNGSDPTASSTAYSAAITVVSGKTYKFAVYSDSNLISEITSIQITA